MNAPDEPRLRKKLREQIGFVERSARAFDEGHEEEALRPATTMRVLFHTTPYSIPLLKHLSMEDATMLSTPRTKFRDWRCFLSIWLHPPAPVPVKLIPRLGVQFTEVPFRDWWESDSVTNAAGQSVSRKTLIVGAANKDGGAHVDAELQEFYEHLVGGEYSLGIKSDGLGPYEQGVWHYPKNGHLALLRQFAHEVLSTVGHCRWIG